MGKPRIEGIKNKNHLKRNGFEAKMRVELSQEENQPKTKDKKKSERKRKNKN